MKRGTIGHPKMQALMDALRIPRFQAVGIVESLIHFTGAYARLGDIGRWSDEQIAAGIDWPTKRAGELISALLSSGWLDRHTDPAIRFIVHDWQEHADDTTKKWVARSGKQFVCPDESGHVQTCHDISGPPLALSQSQNQSQNRPPDAAGEPSETASKRKSVEIPQVLNVPNFLNAWERWKKHRREIGHALKETTMESQLKKLAAWGPEKSVQSLETAIEKGWQGFFEPDKSPDQKIDWDSEALKAARAAKGG